MVDSILTNSEPFSRESVPHVTINHEATVELDSTNAFEGPEKLLEVWFAPAPDALPPGTNPSGLKAVSVETWIEMLDLVNCKILSVVRSENIDAYLLSESSMFIFPHKLILKTCGTTTLLLGLSCMLKVATVNAGFPCCDGYLSSASPVANPYRVFYSRKNFLFPDKQRGPHRSWDKEVEFLDSMFSSGSAYMVGKMNGDHWYLYLTTPNSTLTPPRTPDSEKLESSRTRILEIPFNPAQPEVQGCNDDETLEILMTDLDEENAQKFYVNHATALMDSRSSKNESLKEVAEQLKTCLEDNKSSQVDPFVDQQLSAATLENKSTQTALQHSFPLATNETSSIEDVQGHTLGTKVSEDCGLSDVYPSSKYPNARVDAYLFSPCGFSANGVIPAPEGTATHYFSVHVTPEPQCSYASFETNVPAPRTDRGIIAVVEEVVRIFKPGRFSVTLFEARNESGEESRDRNQLFAVTGPGTNVNGRRSKMDMVEGYRRIDRIVHEFDGYDLVFRYYERTDWLGGAPRVGEVGS
ncbi:hypothetical protein BGHDH14_bgh01104 [Blumeria hordei DH14]|uniref:adenosylmethionine decarboxylase n=1 Tax=Blumeria graminis f. sp. hordei (strain DH14) TaxID=546991 RepID=N1JEM5_BLUG1|nr:hypothetical protein BGHDH14_bgh01104 [Blumeria hordei DH14]